MKIYMVSLLHRATIITEKLNLTNKQLLGLFICVCTALCTLLHIILHRTDLIIFPVTLQAIIIAPMMSSWGKQEPMKGRWTPHPCSGAWHTISFHLNVSLPACLADSNYRIQIRNKTLGFSSIVLHTPSVYQMNQPGRLSYCSRMIVASTHRW